MLEGVIITMCHRRRPELTVWPSLGPVFVALILVYHNPSFLGARAAGIPGGWIPGLGALVVPLQHGHFNSSVAPLPSSRLRRGLLGEARVWLYGSVLTRGYYYINLMFGTPAQRFALIVDTGSTVTYVPCSTCTECGRHQDKPYVPSTSTTYRPVPCQSAVCPAHACDGEGRCKYDRHYAEDSTSSGILADDVVGFGEASTLLPARLLFGCETRETGDLYTQKADGIIGLGRGPLGIMDQLVAQGALADAFSLCYGGWEKGGGAAIFGNATLPASMRYTPLVPLANGSPSTFYNLRIEALKIGGKVLQLASGAFDQGYGVVLDSGTTFTYLPQPVFAQFKAAVIAGVKGLRMVEGPDPQYSDICFGGARSDGSDLQQHFADVTFVFGGAVAYELSPENYLFQHRKVPGAFCLGIFQNKDAGTLIGGIMVRNTLITYDRAGERVGFWKTDCRKLFQELQSLEQAGNAKAPALPPDLAAEPPADVVLPPYNLEAPAPGPQAGASPPLPPNASFHTYTAPGCKGCASQILVSMTLETNYSQFSELTPEFLADMVRELSVYTGQVELDAYSELDEGGVALQFQVVPYQPATYIPTSTVERVQELLSSNQLGLRDAFGEYNVTSVVVVPASFARRHNLQLIWASVAGAALVVLALVGVGMVICLCRRRQHRAASKYATMGETSEDSTTEEEDGLGRSAPRL